MTTDTETTTFTPEDVRSVVIDTRVPGSPTITIDGQDVKNDVAGIVIEMDPKHTPRVTLTVPADRVQATHFEGLAVTELMTVAQPDPGPAAAAFLAAIDAETLEKAAMNRLDLLNGPHELTKAMLRQLTEWADGRS